MARRKAKTVEQVRSETALAKIDIKKQDEIFFQSIKSDKMKELAAIIYRLVAMGKDEQDISTYLGLSPSQIKTIQSSPEYITSVHALVDDPIKMVRTMFVNSAPDVARSVIDKAKHGDDKAQALFFKILGEKKSEPIEDALTIFKQLVEDAGILDKTAVATKKILAKKAEKEQNKLIEEAMEDAIDAEFDIVVEQTDPTEAMQKIVEECVVSEEDVPDEKAEPDADTGEGDEEGEEPVVTESDTSESVEQVSGQSDNNADEAGDPEPELPAVADTKTESTVDDLDLDDDLDEFDFDLEIDEEEDAGLDEIL